MREDDRDPQSYSRLPSSGVFAWLGPLSATFPDRTRQTVTPPAVAVRAKHRTACHSAGNRSSAFAISDLSSSQSPFSWVPQVTKEPHIMVPMDDTMTTNH